MALTLHKKFDALKKILLDMKSMVIAFSGGVDSSFLLKVAHDNLGERVVAVIARSETYPEEEIEHAKDFSRKLGVRHIVIKTEELNNPQFYRNPFNRCYFCKKELFIKLSEIARRYAVRWVADGSNVDDSKDFRPGRLAASELKVRSPLAEAELTKDDIRRLSKKLGLATWDKPSFACLASRFPYHETITRQALKTIDEAESFLRRTGFRQVRVRHYGDSARIEVAKEEIPRLIKHGSRKIINKFKELGYNYVTVDLEGYRTGSMNEVLKVTIK